MWHLVHLSYSPHLTIILQGNYYPSLVSASKRHCRSFGGQSRCKGQYSCSKFMGPMQSCLQSTPQVVSIYRYCDEETENLRFGYKTWHANISWQDQDLIPSISRLEFDSIQGFFSLRHLEDFIALLHMLIISNII